MPPTLASFLTLGFVLALFRRDIKEKPNITNALWVPWLWMMIISTRAVTTWLSMFGLSVGGTSLEEGSNIDAAAYFALIIAGVYILRRRQFDFGLALRSNPALVLYFIYCFIAIGWSDLPFVALKRWIKFLGQPIMVFVLMSEPDFLESFRRLMKRCGYVIVPVSILFIKYYPEWGRGFNPWNGQAYNTGITEGKNALGYDCLILMYFFVWHLLMTLRREKGKERRMEILLCLGHIGMIWWLLSICDSKTPMVALSLALVVLFVTGIKWTNRMIGFYIATAVVIAFVLEQTIGIYEPILQMLGRNATLTERTYLWDDLLVWDVNPLVGIGFESFWVGANLEKVWDLHPWRPNQSHNGYLETYLNLGFIGLGLLLVLVAATYRKVKWALLTDPGFGRFRFPFLFAILVYNWTEASLGGLHPVFLMFLMLSIDYPRRIVVASGSADSGVVSDDAPFYRDDYEPIGTRAANEDA
jgi:hypothetical protein